MGIEVDELDQYPDFLHLQLFDVVCSKEEARVEGGKGSLHPTSES